MLSLLEEYAVLARQLVETLDRWVSCQLEFLERLCADWPQIQSRFLAASDPGVLIEIEQGAGDTHRGGHNVTILTWSSGFRLVYKPRAMTLDLHFQELLTWVNTLGQQPAFRTFSILDKHTYGWCEFVSASDCASREEVERFYQRQGGYLALLYALEATDFHYENLIASGEHATVRAEIDAALQTTLAHGFGLNHSLCHGDMGNLEFVLSAAKLLVKPVPRPDYEKFLLSSPLTRLALEAA